MFMLWYAAAVWDELQTNWLFLRFICYFARSLCHVAVGPRISLYRLVLLTHHHVLDIYGTELFGCLYKLTTQVKRNRGFNNPFLGHTYRLLTMYELLYRPQYVINRAVLHLQSPLIL
jgi:hypothetical protein